MRSGKGDNFLIVEATDHAVRSDNGVRNADGSPHTVEDLQVSFCQSTKLLRRYEGRDSRLEGVSGPGKHQEDGRRASPYPRYRRSVPASTGFWDHPSPTPNVGIHRVTRSDRRHT